MFVGFDVSLHSFDVFIEFTMPAKGSKKGSKKGSNKGGKKGSRKGVATRSSSRLAEKRKEEENTPEVKDEPAAMDVSETETETKTATTVIKEGEKVIDTRKIALDGQSS